MKEETTDVRAVVDVRNVGKTFGEVRALRNVSLSIRPGEIVGLLGPNGAGKTTLMRMISGVMRPDSGEVLLDGSPVGQDLSRAHQLTGSLLSGTSWDERLTGAENLGYWLQMFGMPDQGAVGPALEEVGLGGRGDDLVSTYSAGMKQRLGFARAFITRPRVALLDEPTSALDPASAERFRALIAERCASSGVAALLCTHNMAEAQTLCDSLHVLAKGCIVASGSARELVQRVAHARTRIQVLGGPAGADVLPLGVPARIDGDEVVVDSTVPSEVAAVVTALVRAGHAIYGVQNESLSLAEAVSALTTREYEVLS